MLIVETIAKVRSDDFVKKKAIKGIARERQLSRNTVRKIIRSDATAFTYAPRRVQPMPKLESHKELLDTLLMADAEAKAGRPRTGARHGSMRHPTAVD